LPENPLLPHRKLRELRILMQACRKMEKNASPAREALLAATTIHLVSGDLLCSTTGDATLAALAPKPPKKEARPNGSLLVSPPTLGAIAAATAAARGLQAAGNGVSLALASAGSTEPGWQAALDWAQTSEVRARLKNSEGTEARLADGQPLRRAHQASHPHRRWRRRRSGLPRHAGGSHQGTLRRRSRAHLGGDACRQRTDLGATDRSP
jgi:hypothetical protein